MKQIITTLLKSFEFNVSGERHLVIDPKTPSEVSDEEFEILKKRLGNQIKEFVKPDTTAKELADAKAEAKRIADEKKENLESDAEDL